jgi:uroporphyrinogen III methyltransferase/synthase
MLFIFKWNRRMSHSSPRPGIVFLVGAGPGHPGLITRWGYELLHHCDAVAYDALIPKELIAGLPERVERHYVGKRAGKHSLPQSQINELLATLARRGLKVVRLKGGDPFIYGRSGEEAEYLAKAGIPVIMVPGVTAASAAAALSGFSLTNRQSSSWVFLATGHAAENTGIPVPWDKVGALPGGTLVIYMGLAKLDHVVEELLSSGLAPDIPAIAVQAASTGLQRCIEAPMIDISSECRRQKLNPPALIIIGEAIRSRAKGAEGSAKSLAAKTVLVLSSSRIMHRMCALLREAGAEPIPYPVMTHGACNDAEGWSKFLELKGRGGTCFFQSEAAVDCFMDQLPAHDTDVRSLGRFKIIAHGKSTESALLMHGIKADRILRRFEFNTLAPYISELTPDASLPLIWVRGSLDMGPRGFNLEGKCSEVISLTVCIDSTADWDAHWKDELIALPPDYMAFADPAEVEGFLELVGPETACRMSNSACVAAMDEPVVEALARHGLTPDFIANASDIDSFVQALIKYSQKQLTTLPSF